MEIVTYLLVALGLIGAVYVFYRTSFLQKPKHKSKAKPHFTLKIETE